MKKLHIGAILLGGLAMMPVQAAFAQSQEVAFANDPRPGYVVFFDKGTTQLSSVAGETIRRAAADADRSAGLVRVVGRADYAAAVKNKLALDGVNGYDTNGSSKSITRPRPHGALHVLDLHA